MQYSDEDANENEIKITLKPMNITAIHKRDVNITVKREEKVGDFAKTLLNIMQLSKESPNLVNLLNGGKILDHLQTFEEQGV